jgi:hypothetical protein
VSGSNSVTVSAPASGTVGAFLAITGTVSPGGDAVQLQLSNQNATLPSGPWYGAQATGGVFTSVLLSVAVGTWYVWAYDPVTGAQAVSGAIVVGSSGQATVPIPTSIVASLLGGSAAGDTPDELTAAAAASDGDTALVAQGGKTVFAQPFSAIWSWIQGHLPGYQLPQVTISAAGTVNLDSSAHNQSVLLVTASGVTIMPHLVSLGPGFVCDVINASGAPVALSGIATDTGASAIAAGGIARMLAVTPPGGTLTVYAKL